MEAIALGMMTEAVKGGAELAWRLLATLEGSSLLLVTSALLAYTVRSRVAGTRLREIKKVLVTNTKNKLGKEIIKRLESRGCIVSTLSSEATRGAESGKIDALVVVGAETEQESLNGISQIVTEDIYYNLKLLENLAPLVQRGGCIAWACAGAVSGAFSGAATGFDAVLKASLQHVAQQ